MKTVIFTIALFYSSFLIAQSNEVIFNGDKTLPDKDNFYEVQREFYSKWKTRSPEKGLGYNVFKRWERLMAPRVFPSGDLRLPSTTYENFMFWLKDNEQAANRLAPNNWSALGPFSIPSGYDAGVGRVDFVRFHPTNTSIMFVGTPDGGLWKTTNGGTSWSTNTNFLGVIGCSDLVIHPTNPDIMYLATGNWEGDRRSIGVLKTLNGGTSWSTTSLSWTAIDNYKIRRMIMDPVDPNIMMVATDGGVFRTADGWDTWSNAGLDGNHDLYDLKYKPGSSDVIYASGINGSGVFWMSMDKGVNWVNVSAGLPSGGSVSRIIIGTTPNNADYIYLLAGNGAGGYLGLYRSTNGGTSFSTMSTTPNILQSSKTGAGAGGQATHDLAIAVAPNDANKVTIGGINQWRSTDGGVNWNLFTYWLGIDPNYPGEGSDAPYTHADIQDIQYEPGSSTTMYVTADGGIYKTTNDGTSFTDISSNLSIAQQTTVAQSATEESLIVTGLQDIGTIKKSGTAYSVINGGDGESAFIDRTSTSVMVTSNPNGSHSISYNGGASQQEITGIPAGSEFYSPVSQDPVNADIMYAGGRPAMYKNVDFFNSPNTWVTIGTPPGTGSILEYVVAPSNNQIIYTIKATKIGKTINGGTLWTDVTANLPLGSARGTQITVSNTNPDKAWITFSGYSAGNKVWTTTNGGTSWTNISSGLPNLPFNTVVYVKDSPKDEIYIGGDIGVYQYENPPVTRGPGSWSLFTGSPSTSLPNVKVTDLEIFYPTSGSPKMRASTYGRGTWESEIQGALVPVELVDFNGKVTDKGNILDWSTAEEINLEVYQVERSTNGKDYEMIASVRPKSANSITLESYSLLDRSPEQGLNYYRLKIVDLDGSYDYSPTIVLYNSGSNHVLVVAPNPTSDYFTIKGLGINGGKAYIKDVAGRTIRSLEITEESAIWINYLPNGQYFVEIVEDLEVTAVLSVTKI